MDTLRGEDSTGVFYVNNDENVGWLKHVTPGYTFVESKAFKDILIRSRNLVVAGHNRKATKGEVNVDNAHPFSHGDITLMHNGTLKTIHPLPLLKYDTDSEHICHALSQVSPENAKDVIEKINGAFALVWWDNRDKTLNFIRNNDRTLFVSFESGTNKKAVTMYWASDRNMLKTATHRHYTYEEPESFVYMTHYKYSLSGMNIELVSKNVYKEYIPYPGYAPYQGGSSVVYPGGGRRAHSVKKPRGKIASDTRSQKKDLSVDSSNTKKNVRNNGAGTVPRYLPRIGTYVEVTPFAFKEYPANKDKGRVLGFTMRQDGAKVQLRYVDVILHAVTKKQFDEWNDMDVCLLTVEIVHLSYSPHMKLWNVYGKFKNIAKRSYSANPDQDGPTDDEPEQDNNYPMVVDSYILGPNKSMISEKEFDELTKHGCMNCQTGLTQSDAHKIVWADSQTPLCPDCGDHNVAIN